MRRLICPSACPLLHGPGECRPHHSAARGEIVAPTEMPLAHSVTSGNSPGKAGVVRAIAGSDHCRWVSPQGDGAARRRSLRRHSTERANAAQHDQSFHRITVRAQPLSASVSCTGCGTPSRRVRGAYWRSLGDVACFGRPSMLLIRVRRFRCSNAACPRRTFTEPFPGVARPRARQTDRLRAVHRTISLALGGNPEPFNDPPRLSHRSVAAGLEMFAQVEDGLS